MRSGEGLNDIDMRLYMSHRLNHNAISVYQGYVKGFLTLLGVCLFSLNAFDCTDDLLRGHILYLLRKLWKVLKSVKIFFPFY